MAQTYTRLLLHAVFSTKHRAPLITDDWRDDLHAYIGGIAKHRNAELLAAGSVEDHIHLLLRFPATIAVADLMRDIKTNSSGWRREKGDSGFGWQNGYAGFTVTTSILPDVVKYLTRQREHHRAQTFQDEFVELLNRNEVEYDVQYLWE
ncbi:MAG: transposase [Fimbriiglobus sp.]|nr:transposase [Fimbriiglobus sp.]